MWEKKADADARSRERAARRSFQIILLFLLLYWVRGRRGRRVYCFFCSADTEMWKCDRAETAQWGGEANTFEGSKKLSFEESSTREEKDERETAATCGAKKEILRAAGCHHNGNKHDATKPFCSVLLFSNSYWAEMITYNLLVFF